MNMAAIIFVVLGGIIAFCDKIFFSMADTLYKRLYIREVVGGGAEGPRPHQYFGSIGVTMTS